MKIIITNKSLAYLGYALLVFKYTMALTAYNLTDEVGHVIVAIALGCLAINIISEKLKGRMVYFFLIMIIVAAMQYIITREDYLIIMVVTVFAIRNLDIKKLIQIYVIIVSLIFVGVVLCSIITRENIFLTKAYRTSVGVETRYTFGFIHPNSLQGAFVSILGGLALRSHSIYDSKIRYLLLEILNIILYSFSGSRTGLLIGTFLILGLWIVKDFKSWTLKKSFYYLSEGIFLFVVIGTILAVRLYKKSALLQAINVILTGRFSLASRYADVYSVNWLGNNLTDSVVTFAVDCGIYQSLIQCGIIVYAFFIIIYMYGIKLLWEKGRAKEIVVVLSFVLYCLAESKFINIFSNIGLLICFIEVMNVYKKREDRNGLYERLHRS
ncbi:MAG: hypothetical protein LUC95_10835 [Lachnospiraceae bacterium]|nr:hypothetical protein [Lachnospiraceae bacterium]